MTERIGHCVTFCVELPDGNTHRFLVEREKTVGVIANQIADEFIAQTRRLRKRTPSEGYTLMTTESIVLPVTRVVSSDMEGQRYKLHQIEVVVD
jgi:hypothetical protein